MPAIDLDALRPADTPAYMTPMWLGCIHWAIGEPEIVACFRADTGLTYQPGRTGIERMIDEATGIDREFIEAFIRWVNVNIWGPIDGPPTETRTLGSLPSTD